MDCNVTFDFLLLLIIMVSTSHTPSILHTYSRQITPSSIPLFWPVIIPYLIWIAIWDQAPNHGGRSRDFLRKSTFWVWFASYYPVSLIKVCCHHLHIHTYTHTNAPVACPRRQNYHQIGNTFSVRRPLCFRHPRIRY